MASDLLPLWWQKPGWIAVTINRFNLARSNQVPVKSSHSTMLWPKWVVLITGSTGSALRAARPICFTPPV